MSFVLLALLSGCDCALGEKSFVYGGGELEIELVSDGALNSGTWVVPGVSQAEIDEYQETGGAVAENLSVDGGSYSQVRWIGLGKNRWVVFGYAELGEEPIEVDACGGRAQYLVFEASPDGAEARFAADPTAILEPDDPAVDPTISPPLLDLFEIGVDAGHRAVTGEVHAQIQATSTAPGCGDPDLGGAEFVVTWEFDEDVVSQTGSCKWEPGLF